MLFFSYSEYYFHKNMRHMLLFAKGGRKDFFFSFFFILPKALLFQHSKRSHTLMHLIFFPQYWFSEASYENSFLFNKEEHWSIIKFKSNLRFTTWKIFNAFNNFKVFHILCYFVCCALKNFQFMKYVNNLALYSTDKINRWTRYL